MITRRNGRQFRRSQRRNYTQNEVSTTTFIGLLTYFNVTMIIQYVFLPDKPSSRRKLLKNSREKKYQVIMTIFGVWLCFSCLPCNHSHSYVWIWCNAYITEQGNHLTNLHFFQNYILMAQVIFESRSCVCFQNTLKLFQRHRPVK